MNLYIDASLIPAWLGDSLTTFIHTHYISHICIHSINRQVAIRGSSSLYSGAVLIGPPSLSGIPHLQLPSEPHTNNHLAMSQSASPYPAQSSFYSTPPMVNSALNTDTPPPPPPKPSSHEASRGNTPQNMTSIPAPQQTPAGYRADSQGAGVQQTPYSQPAPLPAPPTVEEGWLPEIVKDKS